MSLNLEMMQVAGLAPRLLKDASQNVIEFIDSQFDPQSGGYIGRDGKADIYYTIFALSCLRALKGGIPKDDVLRFIDGQCSLEQLRKMDFVTLSSIARVYTLVPDAVISQSLKSNILEHLAAYRSRDGAWHNFNKDEQYGSPYGSFLALGCLQDLGEDLPAKAGIIESLNRLKHDDGTYANDEYSKIGTTTVTAAALAIMRLYYHPIDEELAINGLLKMGYIKGGFFASSMSPIPDLLSSATALHALSGLNYDLGEVKELQLDYVDSLWSSQGGFHGNWTDESLDCEYTFYGLLALGHLSL